MSLIATLLRQNREAVAARDEAAIHRFEVICGILKENNDLSDAVYYGLKIAHGDSKDSGITRKIEFSNEHDSIALVVRSNGKTYIDGEEIGDLDAKSAHTKLCEAIVNQLLS